MKIVMISLPNIELFPEPICSGKMTFYEIINLDNLVKSLIGHPNGLWKKLDGRRSILRGDLAAHMTRRIAV